jgi:hypothetical protein
MEDRRVNSSTIEQVWLQSSMMRKFLTMRALLNLSLLQVSIMVIIKVQAKLIIEALMLIRETLVGNLPFLKVPIATIGNNLKTKRICRNALTITISRKLSNRMITFTL